MTRHRFWAAVGFFLTLLVRPASADPLTDYWARVWSAKVVASRPVSDQPVAVVYDWHYKDRVQLDAAAVEYVQRLSSSNTIFYAPDLDDYLERLLTTVYPGSLPAGHPGSLNIRVVESPDPNAFSLSDGSVLVTTSLISLAHSQDELLGAIAHEVAHVILDHNMERTSAAKARANMATILGTAAGVAAGVAATRSTDPTIQYYAGDIAVDSFIMGTMVSSAALDLVGAKYSRDQEEEADQVAQGWLRVAHRDTTAFSRLLIRLSNLGETRGMSPRASLSDDHPGMVERVKLLNIQTTADSSSDPAYDARVAVCETFDAKLALSYGRHAEAASLCDRVIASGWADGETLILRAATTRAMSTNEDSLRSALSLLERAERVHGYTGPGLFVERALLQLRLGDEGGALRSLRQADGALKVEGAAGNRELQDWLARTISRLVARTK